MLAMPISLVNKRPPQKVGSNNTPAIMGQAIPAATHLGIRMELELCLERLERVCDEGLHAARGRTGEERGDWLLLFLSFRRHCELSDGGVRVGKS